MAFAASITYKDLTALSGKSGRSVLSGLLGSVRSRLLLLTAAALIPAFAVIAYTQWDMSRWRRAEVNEVAARNVRFAASELERVIDGIHNALTAVGYAPAVQALDAACNNYLDEIRANLEQFSWLAAADPAGAQVCGADAISALAERSYFQQALTSRTMVIGEYTLAQPGDRRVLPVAVALRGRDGELARVMVAAVDLKWIGEKMKERGLPPGGSLTIADRNGVILMREPYPEQFVGTRIPDSYRRLVNAPGPGTEHIVSQDGTVRVIGYWPAAAPPGLYVSAGISADTNSAAVARAAQVGLAIAAAGTILALLAAWYVGNRVFMRPISLMTATMQRWREGDQGARTGFMPRSELGHLGAELDRLMSEIEKHQNERELLVNELAHRVKNTLTTVQAIANSTFRNEGAGKNALPDFQARIAALSRAHDALIHGNWESASLDTIVRGVTGPLAGGGERFVIGGPMVKLAPKQVLAMTMLLHELCTNALKYGALSKPGGRVQIAWSDGSASAPILLLRWIEQDGPPVKQPQHAGFGSRMIRRLGAELGRIDVDYRPNGLVCEIEATLSSDMPPRA